MRVRDVEAEVARASDVIAWVRIGVLVVGLIVMVMELMELDQESWWGESRFIALAEPVAEQLQGFLKVGLEHLEDVVAPDEDTSREPETE